MSACSWPDAPPEPSLSRGDVRIFCAPLDPPPDTLESHASSLSADEHARAERFVQPLHRTRFVAARGFLRAVLGQHLGVQPARVRFAYGAKGKPALAGAPIPLHFNLSHSSGLCLCALALDVEVGVDLEHVGRNVDLERIAARFFSPGEARTLLSLPETQRRRAFFACWTRKEAFIKAKGGGLSIPLRDFDVSLRRDEPAALLRTAWDPDEAPRWRIRELTPAPDFLAAVAFEAMAPRLRCYSWS